MTDPDALASTIAERLAQVRRRIERAAATAGRDPEAVRVVAITKGFGLNEVRAARRAGLERIGENRVADAEPKVVAVPDVEWHLVGHLQSNKARRALALFPWIHAVDSVALLERLETIAVELGVEPRVLIQVNLTDAPTQHGFAPDALAPAAADRAALVEAASRLRVVRVAGLMGIGPMTADADESRAAFARLRALRDELQVLMETPLPELSMGMSGDLEAAVSEGATLIRIGTALFGARPAG